MAITDKEKIRNIYEALPKLNCSSVDLGVVVNSPERWLKEEPPLLVAGKIPGRVIG